MAAVPSEAQPQRRPWPRWLVDEVAASMAIATMWLAVAVDALWGPDMVFSSAAGTSYTRIPSAVVVAFFAYLGTRVVARYMYRPAATP